MSVIPKDEFREKHGGWKGEWELFRAAQAQHSVKHEEMVPECEVCVVIYRNINRLAAEVENFAAHIRDQRQ